MRPGAHRFSSQAHLQRHVQGATCAVPAPVAHGQRLEHCAWKFDARPQCLMLILGEAVVAMLCKKEKTAGVTTSDLGTRGADRDAGGHSPFQHLASG